MTGRIRKTAGVYCAVAMAWALAGCGGGGNSNPNPPAPAPSGLSYPTPPTFQVGTTIATLTPTVMGAPTSYAISPVLPAGLSLDTASGAISGTPTAAQATTNHTVTASNAGGSTTTTLSITVIDVAPSVAYPRAAYSFTTHNAIADITPISDAGVVVTWSAEPALPAGLTLDAATGEISGTPTTESAAATYRITATNSGGIGFFDLSIEVTSGILLELGHDTEISRIVYTDTRVLTIDARGRTRLFDAQTGATLVREEPACTVTCGDIARLAGNVLVVRRPDGFHVYDATTGERTGTIERATTAYTGNWDLSTDGSYIVDRRIDGMAAWSTDGTELFVRTTGNYAGAKVFAAPDQFRIGDGPLGAQIVEYIAMPGGAVTQSATLLGIFHSWFRDGERFLTRSGGVAVVYSHDAVQEWTLTLANFDGLDAAGDWVWNDTLTSGQLDFYAVNGPGTVAATVNLGSAMPLTYVAPLLVSKEGLVIDLSTPTPAGVQLDAGAMPQPSAFGVRSTTDWVQGNRHGVVIARPSDPQPLQLSRGRVYSIAGSDARIALAFASGELLIYDAATRTLEQTIDFPTHRVALSRDGSTLAASGGSLDPQDGRALRLYSLPAASVIFEWPHVPGNQIDTFSLSDDGAQIGQQLGSTRQVVRQDGSVVLTESGAASRVHLSPSGDFVAIPAQSLADVIYAAENATSNLYSEGTLSAGAAGHAVGWIDESRLLVTRYAKVLPSDPYGAYDESFIVGADGVDIAATPFPFALRHFQRIDHDRIYYSETNSVYDVTTAAELWHNPLGGGTDAQGAVAGNFVVYAADAFIRADPYD